MADHTHIEHSRNIVHNSQLDAQGNITVGDQYITNLYLNADYGQLMQREAELQEMLDFYQAKGDAQQALKKSGELNEHRKRIEQFKSNVLRLAETFSNIKVYDERLTKARSLFEEGKFEEVGKLLNERTLADELDLLNTQRGNLEAKASILANTFLVKAQATALDYESLQRFEDSCRYFEASIQSQENHENLFAYAYFLQEHNQHNQAQKYLERYLSRFGTTLSDPQRATALNNLGALQQNRNEYPAAQASYQEALDIRRRLAQVNPQTYLPVVAGILNNLGLLQTDRNEYVAAQASYQEALDIQRTLAQANPQTYFPDVAMTLNNLGNLQANRNEYPAAQASFQEALEAFRTLAQANPQTYLPDVAVTLNNLGNLQANRNEYLAAQASYQEALEVYRTLAQNNPQTWPYVAGTLNNLGVLQWNRNEYAAAQASYQEALDAYRTLAKANPQTYLPYVAGILVNWAELNQNLNPQTSLLQVQEGLEILVPFVEGMPFAQGIFWRALRVIQRLGHDPAAFLVAHNLPQNLLTFQS